jgi:hypothetical protein
MSGLPSRESRRILAALPNAPPGVTQVALVACHGVKRKTLQLGALTWLLREGHVTRAGAGRRGDPYRYWLSPGSSYRRRPDEQ